jgi:hypothetical protein
LKKEYFDFLSDYLVHNSLFLQKSLATLFAELGDIVSYNVARCYMCTDGAKFHFKTRILFYWASTIYRNYGISEVGIKQIKIIFLLGILFHWWFDPPYHGKGECDGHGSVVKRKIRRYILKGVQFILFCCVYKNLSRWVFCG